VIILDGYPWYPRVGPELVHLGEHFEMTITGCILLTPPGKPFIVDRLLIPRVKRENAVGMTDFRSYATHIRLRLGESGV